MKKTPLLLLGLVALTLALPSHAGRTTGGNYNLPAGNPVLSGTTISSTWANSTMADIKVEITNSLSRDGFGTMRAPLRVPDGSAAIPAFAFNNDNAAGLYLAGSADVRMSISPTAMMKWTVAGTTALERLTCEKGVVVTNSATNGAGITATGNGTGQGIQGNGSTAGSVGVLGTGTVNNAGVSGVGQGTAAGVTGTGGGTNGTGVTGAGQGTGSGVSGTGGASGASASTGIGVLGTGGGSGPGIRGVGGTGGGDGVVAVGGGASGRGINAVGGTGQVGGLFTPGSGGTNAISLNGGYLMFSGTSNPASTTGFNNTLTPSNMVKAWVEFTVTAAGVISVVGGFNVSSVIANSNRLIIAFPSGGSMTTAYAVHIQTGDNTATDQPPLGYYVDSKGTSSVSFKGYSYTGTIGVVNLGTRDARYFVTVVGNQ